MIRKKSSIIFDDKPIENSENAVTSGGVFKAIQQGGGGGTSDYSQLTNKPQINNIELVGNKSLTALGIASTADLTTVNSAIQGINADIINLQDDKADSTTVTALTNRVSTNETSIGNLSNLTTTAKTDLVSAINEVASGGGGGTSDYSQLTNKPQINNIELVGNKSLTALGIASTADLTTVNSAIQGINADIINLQDDKADKSQLPNMTLYATKLEAEAIADRVTENESDIATIETTLTNKADSSTVTALTNRVSTNETSIGNLSNLTTTAKTDLVSAVNENASDIATIETALTNKADSSTVTALTNRVSTNETSIGNLSNLTTTAKTDLVSAINEVASGGGGGGITIKKHTIAGAQRELSSGKFDIVSTSYPFNNKPILKVVVKMNNDISSQFISYGAICAASYLTVRVIYTAGSTLAEALQMTYKSNFGFDVYYED